MIFCFKSTISTLGHVRIIVLSTTEPVTIVIWGGILNKSLLRARQSYLFGNKLLLSSS